LPRPFRAVKAYTADMTATPTRVEPGKLDRYDERRAELAESALATLAELGFARTSLREIASRSKFSHGVVHYYFRDKVELITHCVRVYKATCVTRYDTLVAESRTAEELRERFAERLAETLVEDAPMHRLWYDLRTQAMFDGDFRDDVMAIENSLEAMIWHVVARYCELAGCEPAFDSHTAYALLDGPFEKALLGHLLGDADAVPGLVVTARRMLPIFAGH
jgi:TetR/AcrR family transcriptional repressor of bet genes